MKREDPDRQQVYKDMACKDEERYFLELDEVAKKSHRSMQTQGIESNLNYSKEDRGSREVRRSSGEQRLDDLNDEKPSPPKKALGLTAWNCFVKANMKEQTIRNPEKRQSEIMQMLSAKWKGLNPQELKKYQDMAAEDTKRCADEKDGLLHQGPAADAEMTPAECQTAKKSKSKARPQPNELTQSTLSQSILSTKTPHLSKVAPMLAKPAASEPAAAMASAAKEDATQEPPQADQEMQA